MRSIVYSKTISQSWTGWIRSRLPPTTPLGRLRAVARKPLSSDVFPQKQRLCEKLESPFEAQNRTFQEVGLFSTFAEHFLVILTQISIFYQGFQMVFG